MWDIWFDGYSKIEHLSNIDEIEWAIYLGMLYTAPDAVAIKRFFVVIPFSVIVSLRAVTNAGPRI